MNKQKAKHLLHYVKKKYDSKSNNKKNKKKSKTEDLYKNSNIYFWGKEVRIQHDYRCVICGTCRWLSAHHIFAKSKFPKLMYNLSNGVLLCRDCHAELHQLNDIIIKR